MELEVPFLSKTIDNNGVFTQRSIGIINTDQFTLHSSSIVTITDIEAAGAAFATGIQNSGTFNGNGKITIDSLDGGSSFGIYNTNAFTFSGDSLIINLIRDINDDTDGIKTFSSFTNSNGSTIKISNANYAVQNLNNGSTFVNHGDLIVEGLERDGIFNEAIFYNYGSLRAEGFSFVNGTNAGIHNDSIFINFNGGHIYLNDGGASICPLVTCPRPVGIQNDHIFDNRGILEGTSLHSGYIGKSLLNHGTIEFYDLELIAIESDSLFNNTGNVEIKRSGRGILNHRLVTNNSTGRIAIDSSFQSFLNDGVVENEIGATLDNEGHLSISRSNGLIAIKNDGSIINSDSIIIDQLRNHGIFTPSTATLDTSIWNKPSGVISISNREEVFGSEWAIEDNKKIINQGSMHFKNLPAGQVINNFGILNNSGTI